MPTVKSNSFAFRCDDQIAYLLESEISRSETIIRALREYYQKVSTVTCPTCNGVGHIYNPIRKTTKLRKKIR